MRAFWRETRKLKKRMTQDQRQGPPDLEDGVGSGLLGALGGGLLRLGGLLGGALGRGLGGRLGNVRHGGVGERGSEEFKKARRNALNSRRHSQGVLQKRTEAGGWKRVHGT